MSFSLPVNTFLFFVVILFASCTRKESTGSSLTPKEVWSWSSAPQTLDWNEAAMDSDLAHALLVMDGLTRLAPQSSTKIEPALLQKFQKLSPTRYIFSLKPGVLYSNGASLTATDFQVAWLKLRRSRNPFRSLVAKFETIRPLSALELEVRLTAPDPFLLLKLSHPSTFPWPPSIVPLASAPTLGAYQLESQTDKTLVYTRNPTYHQEPAPIEQIQVEIIASESDRKERASQGEFNKTEAVHSQALVMLVLGNPKRVALPLPLRKLLATSIDTEETVKLTGSFLAPAETGPLLTKLGSVFIAERTATLPKFPALALQTPPGLIEIAKNLRAQWLKNLGVQVEISNSLQVLALEERPLGTYFLEENLNWLRANLPSRSESLAAIWKQIDAATDWESIEGPLAELENTLTSAEFSVLVLGTRLNGQLTLRPGKPRAKGR